MRRVLVLVVVLGCGQPHSQTDPDGAVDGDGTLIGDGGIDGIGDIDAPGSGSICPTGQWCLETAPIASTVELFSVHVVDAGDVFAVGTGGTIIRRRNNAWTAMTSGTTENLRAVWAANGNEAWAVGANGTVLHWNGTAWTPVTGLNTINNLASVWGFAANDVYVVGTSRVWHFDGSVWSSTPIAAVLLSVRGSGPQDVWIATESGYLKHNTGSGFTTVMPGTGTDYYSVWSLGPSNVWAANSSTAKETVNWNGTTWVQHATGSYAFQALWGTSSTNVWGVFQSYAGHWDGSSWTVAQPTGITNVNTLWSVSGKNADVWVVGAQAKILYRH